MRSFSGYPRRGPRMGAGSYHIPGLAVRGGGRLAWAQDAWGAWDFLTNEARYAGSYKGALANTPNWTFTRASTGYAQNAAGVLIPFASGELRRTDKGVLIEGARTNLCFRSQEFDNASWTKERGSIGANATVAPDGTATADLLTEDGTAGNSHRAYQAVITTAVAHTFSLWYKPNGRTWIALRLTDSGDVARHCWFNCSGVGSVGTAETGMSGTIRALANGWYAVSATITAAFAGSRPAIISLANADATVNYDGDGVSGGYLWGAQLEAGAFPSSYIPTTTASATRAADALSITGVSGLDYPLTLFTEWERGVDTGANETLIATTNTSADYAALRVSTGDIAQGAVVAGSASQGFPSQGTALGVGSTKRAAIRVSVNNLIVAQGGALGSADTSSSNPAAPTAIEFGALSGASHSFGYLRRAAIWSRGLSDAELQAVTT